MSKAKYGSLIAFLMIIIIIFSAGRTTVAEAATGEAKVTTQKQLEKALKNNNVTRIIIKPSKAAKFTIPKG